MTAEKKLESLIYDLEGSIDALKEIEESHRKKGDNVTANFASIRADIYKEILNKIK